MSNPGATPTTPKTNKSLNSENTVQLTTKHNPLSHSERLALEAFLLADLRNFQPDDSIANWIRSSDNIDTKTRQQD